MLGQATWRLSATARLAALGVSLLAAGARGQEASDCLACHSDPDLSTERNGRKLSLHVAEKPFTASVHASLGCSSCHADTAGMEGAHDTPLKPVDCGACHEAETKQHAASLHGRAMQRGDTLAPSCASCHGKHDIRAVKDPASPVSPLKVPSPAASATRKAPW